MKSKIKSALKTLRASQPFNYLATSSVRATLRATGIKPDFPMMYLRRYGPVQDRLPDGRRLRFWSHEEDSIPNKIFWLGWDGHEEDTIPLFYRLAKHSKVTLDIGAHVGLFTLLAAHANPRGKVYAFEPLQVTHKKLKHNVFLNRLRNVHCVANGVGETKGTVDFFYNEGLPDTSSMLQEHTESCQHFSSEGEVRKTTISVITLDEFVQENNIECVDLVKIDTEGTEPQVFRGMAETLRRDHPHLIVEVLKGMGTEKPIEEILGPLGYRYYLLTESGPKLYEHIEAQPDGRFESRNYLFSTLSPDEISQI